jgi:hypothetical protein
VRDVYIVFVDKMVVNATEVLKTVIAMVVSVEMTVFCVTKLDNVRLRDGFSFSVENSVGDKVSVFSSNGDCLGEGWSTAVPSFSNIRAAFTTFLTILFVRPLFQVTCNNKIQDRDNKNDMHCEFGHWGRDWS